jgi:hypothetical protein
MTTIFKVSDQEKITPVFTEMEASITRESGAELPDQQWPASLSDDGIAEEMDKVEKCAASGKDYVFNAEWPAEQVAQLKEYASVCNLTGKMIPARQAAVVAKTNVEDVDPEMERLAAITATTHPKIDLDLALAVGDPFHLTDKNDIISKQDNWEKVHPERKLASAPQIDVRSGITPIRGEFEYGTSTQLRVRPGENSVADPNAIGKLSKEQDSGERLATENKERRTARTSAKKLWEKEVVQKGKELGAGSLPRGSVFMTAAAPDPIAQSSLDIKTAVAELDKIAPQVIPDIPSLTEGEKIHNANVDRKVGIQRTSSKDDWQQVKGTTKPSLTDVFANALEFQLKKAGIQAQTDDIGPEKRKCKSCGHEFYGLPDKCPKCNKPDPTKGLDPNKPMPSVMTVDTTKGLNSNKPMPSIY